MKNGQTAGIRRSVQVVVVVLGAVAMIGSPPAWAAGFRNPPESATGLGKLGARYTLVDDASAMAFNPANLSGLESGSGMISADLALSETEFDSVLGHAKTRNSGAILPNAFFAWPSKELGGVLGIGLTTPFGQSTEWSKTSVFRYTAPYFAELAVLNVNPSYAVKLTDALSAGVGADVFYSSLDFRQIFPWSLVTGSALAPDGVTRFDADGWGVGGNVGLTWRIGERHLIGLIHRSPVSVDYDGDFTVSGMPPPLMAAGLTPESDLETKIKFPALTGLGYGVRVSDTLRLGVEAEWVEFSTFDTLDLDVANNQPLLGAGAKVPESWNDTWTAAAGAEWQCSKNWQLLAGYIFMENPVPDRTFSPTLPDGDQHVVSLGAGCTGARDRFHFTYATSFNENRTIRNPVDPASPAASYNGHYDIKNSHMISASYSRAF